MCVCVCVCVCVCYCSLTIYELCVLYWHLIVYLIGLIQLKHHFTNVYVRIGVPKYQTNSHITFVITDELFFITSDFTLFILFSYVIFSI